MLGTLPPPYRLKMGGSENTPEGGWLTEFRIIGFKDGWFLIEGATPPGKEYEDEKKYPRNAPKPYARPRLGRRQQGRRQLRQWRHAHGRAVPGAVRRCEVDAGRSASSAAPLDTDGGPKRLLACSGHWGLVESQDGVRGWWRSLCSNQVTNCS